MKTPDVQPMFQALITTWETLRTGAAKLPLPSNVLILPLTELRGRPGKLGHFCHSRWVQRPDGIHEVAVHPGLFHDAEDLLLVLLHEAAHSLLLDRYAGCSADGYYHRKQFRDQCRRIGLRCDFTDTRHGWNNTRWPEDGVPECYQEALEVLRTQLTLAAAIPESVPDREGIPLPKSGRIPMTCGCEQPRRIYVSRGVAQGGGIRCEVCDEMFTVSTETLDTD
jgi:hypothetical protein